MESLKNTYNNLALKKPKTLGRSICILNALVGALGFTFVKKVTSLDGLEIAYWRGMTNFVWGISMMIYLKIDIWPADQSKSKILLSAIAIGALGVNCKMISIQVNPLQKYEVLQKTDSMQTLIFSWLFLGERLSPILIISCCLSFLGMLLIIDPGLLGISSLDAESITILGGFVGLAAASSTACRRIFIGNNKGKLDTFQNLAWFGMGIGFIGAL